ncbi:hypothetical protein DFQ28_001117 [Apophysomyces sp. BC1034]|nr:hypothetical protein DFQ28_001117 [Apophysomyces sp. BC1034]
MVVNEETDHVAGGESKIKYTGTIDTNVISGAWKNWLAVSSVMDGADLVTGIAARGGGTGDGGEFSLGGGVEESSSVEDRRYVLTDVVGFSSATIFDTGGIVGGRGGAGVNFVTDAVDDSDEQGCLGVGANDAVNTEQVVRRGAAWRWEWRLSSSLTRA